MIKFEVLNASGFPEKETYETYERLKNKYGKRFILSDETTEQEPIYIIELDESELFDFIETFKQEVIIRFPNVTGFLEEAKPIGRIRIYDYYFE